MSNQQIRGFSNAEAKKSILAKIDEAIDNTIDNHIGAEIAYHIQRKFMNREQKRSEQGVAAEGQMEGKRNEAHMRIHYLKNIKENLENSNELKEDFEGIEALLVEAAGSKQ